MEDPFDILALPSGITHDQISDAIRKSGYPLQFFTGELLRNWAGEKDVTFSVQDEWGFLDRDTKEIRNLDIRADLRLHGWDPQPRVRPQLTLLIECKQSELPYIFFGRKTQFGLVDYPPIAGLNSDEISIRTGDSGSTWNLSLSSALGLDGDSFQTYPMTCTSFAKCQRKGKELELSGTDPYNSLVQPLTKALDHFHRIEKPVKTARYFDAHLTIAIAVLDSPILSVSIEDGAQKIAATSWVRLIKHEFDDSAPKFHQDAFSIIEVVHKNFLSQFLSEHLLPFVRKFASAVLRHPAELATGRGFANKIEGLAWDQIAQELKPDEGISLSKI